MIGVARQRALWRGSRTTARIESGIGAAETTANHGVVAETLHRIAAVTVDDHKKRTGDARDKKSVQDPKERRREFSLHPARDRSSNCECTQVANVCAFLDAPAPNEADRADDRLLSASSPHPSRNPHIPSLHFDVLPDDTTGRSVRGRRTISMKRQQRGVGRWALNKRSVV